jgi:periplasmic protein TonB
MFDTVLGRGQVPNRRLGAGLVLALVVHALLLAVALWVSSQPVALAEAKAPEVLFYAAPPPPPPPPPPRSSGIQKARVEQVEQKRKPVKKPDTVVKARELPPEQPTETEPEADPEMEAEAEDETEVVEGVVGGVAGGVIGGVIGGVHGGVVGGVIGGTLGGQLGGQRGGEVLPFGEGMTRPQRLSGRDPVQTREAREARIEGRMLVKCVITIEGTLESCRIIKPLPHMEEAVLSALRTWRMSPVYYQGRPVSVDYVIPIRVVTQ